MTNNQGSKQQKGLSALFRILFFIGTADVIWNLQIGLPIESFNRASRVTKTSAFSNPQNDTRNAAFWNRRFQFEQFFRPHWSEDIPGHQLLSAAVCKDELIVLLKSSNSAECESIRLNLATNRVTRSAAPAESCYVIADAKRVWFLPHYDRFAVWNKNRTPFILDGRPVAIVKYAHNPNLFQLIEFVDGRWQESHRFLLVPGRYTEIACFPMTDGSHFIVFNAGHDKIMHRIGIETGSEAEAVRFDAAYARQVEPLTEIQLSEIGWEQYDVPNFVTLDPKDQKWQLLGYRAVSNAPSLLFDSHNGQGNLRFSCPLWHHCSTRLAMTPEAAEVSSQFQKNVRFGAFGSQIQGATSLDGDNYVVLKHRSEGQLRILYWDRDQFRQIAHFGSPLVWLICLDGGLFLAFAVGIPMLLFAFVAGICEWWRGPRQFSSSRETLELASIVRRGMARSIDLILVGIPLFLSIVCHPDFVIWWIEMGQFWSTGWNSRYYSSNWISWVKNSQLRISDTVLTIFCCPAVTWLFVLSLLMISGQIVWQAESGRTIGKWLCGIEVMRKSLRPCGLARSLLREIVLVVDSVFLLSWVPGVFAILLTTHSQRIGDRLADTIVIKSPSPTPSIQ